MIDHGDLAVLRSSLWPTRQLGGGVSSDLLEDISHGDHRKAASECLPRPTRLPQGIGHDEKITSLLHDRPHGFRA